MPTPTPTPDPYAPRVVVPDTKPISSSAAVPATVPITTSSRVIEANLAAAKAQNSAIREADGIKAGGSRKQKRSRKLRHKRSNKHKRSNRSSRRRRSKRGGAPTITPRPTTTVPQFGPMHAGANDASLRLNSGAMNQSAQAKYDDPNGPPTTKFLQ